MNTAMPVDKILACVVQHETIAQLNWIGIGFPDGGDDPTDSDTFPVTLHFRPVAGELSPWGWFYDVVIEWNEFIRFFAYHDKRCGLRYRLTLANHWRWEPDYGFLREATAVEFLDERLLDLDEESRAGLGDHLPARLPGERNPPCRGD